MKQHFLQWQAGRESRASEYFGLLFGGSIMTILAIRAFLAVTGYPQLGTDSLHIAHMLWGGLFLLASVIVILYYHGHRAKIIGSVVAGIGLGFFIDELGKFITADNDYFYQPTPMLLYIFFIILWLIFNRLDSYIPTSNRQRYIDMITRLRDSTIHGMTQKDKKIILAYSKKLGFSKKQQDELLYFAKKYTPVYKQTKTQIRYYQLKNNLQNLLIKLIKHSIFKKIIYLLLIFTAILSFSIIVNYLVTMQLQTTSELVNTPNIILIGIIISCSISFVLYVLALYKGFSSFNSLLVWYKRGLLVNIFGTQVFLFYTNQFVAAFGLFGALIMLIIINFLLNFNDINKVYNDK